MIPPGQTRSHRIQSIRWLMAFALIGIALVFLYRDADQQDAGYHFLFARWAWQEPWYLIGVWTRPLFTLVYSLPAQFGYPAAKLFTLALCLATGFQVYKLALDLGLERAQLAVPFLMLQPAYFLLVTETQTESLFAFLLVIALRLDFRGYTRTGRIAASLLILVRPEGFFIALIWGVWTLLDVRNGKTWIGRAVETIWLACGVVIWWLAAWTISGDPLWIGHDWPGDWEVTRAANGRGPIWWYLILLPMVVGPVLLPLFALGLHRLMTRRQFLLGVGSFLMLFAAHSVMFWRGWFGAAGYARYLVCVSPAIAIITLVGWNQVANRIGRVTASVAALVSLVICVYYVDGYRFTRDSRAIDEMVIWLHTQPLPISRLVFSQSYMCIRLDCSPLNRVLLTADVEQNLEVLRESPGPTLVFWDAEVGPKFYGLEARDFEACGYRRLRSQAYHLEGWFFRIPWRYHGGPRLQEMHLFYR